MKKFIGLLIVSCMIVGIVGLTGCTSKDSNDTKNQAETEETADQADAEGADTASGSSISTMILKDQPLDIKTLRTYFNDFKSRDLCIPFQTGVDVYNMLNRNSAGEVVVSYASGMTTISDAKHNTVYFGNDITSAIDVDNVYAMELFIEEAESGSGKLLVSDLSEEAKATTYQFVIDVKGYAGCEAMFNKVSDGYGKVMRETLATSSKENGHDPETEDINLRMMYILNDTGLYSGTFYIYYGDQELGLGQPDFEKCLTMWMFSTVYGVYEWALPDEWLAYDFSVINAENTDQIYQMAQGIMKEVNKAAEDYYQEHYKPLEDEAAAANGSSDTKGSSGTSKVEPSDDVVVGSTPDSGSVTQPITPETPETSTTPTAKPVAPNTKEVTPTN